MNKVDVYQWEELAESARGLLARPYLPNNVVVLRSHIASITYEVYEVGGSGTPVIGTLVVSEVMLTAPSGKNTWDKDAIGFTFVWEADGSLWPDPDKTYQIVVIFTTTIALGSKSFKRIWRVTTKNPASVS